MAPPLVCLVMELCDSSLHRLIHPHHGLRTEVKDFLPPQLICSLLCEVVSGMLFLHGTMGIQHGDLKPLNILLSGGTLKLCDFGSSRLLQFPTAELAFTGTLPYMAPELLVPSKIVEAGSADTAARAIDVYSFGICLWETCTRQFPWRQLLEQGMVVDLKRRVGIEGERPPSDLSPQALPRPLRLLLAACWRQDPAARPTFAQLAELDLEHLCSSKAAEEQLVRLVERTERDATSLLNRSLRQRATQGVPGMRDGDEAVYRSPAVVPPHHTAADGCRRA